MSITLLIVILTGYISYQAFNRADMFYKLNHSPYRELHQQEYHRLLTAGFVHGDFTHLFVNLFVLWSFGGFVEKMFLNIFGETMGRINFLLLYTLTIVFANIPTYFKHRGNPNFISVGASGGISGLVFASLIFQPWGNIYLFFIVPMPAIVFGVVYLIYSNYASRNLSDRIDHDAHFYGAVFGFLLTVLLKPSLFGAFLNNLLENHPFQ